MRSDSTLRSLTPDQLDDLFDWISTYSYRGAMERAAKPVPDGFDLRLQKNTLVRFFKAEERKRHAQELAELALVDEGAPEIAKLIKAAKVDFAHCVYELARCVDSDSFARLESALHRIERCEIDREKVGLRKEEIALHRERLAMDRLHGQFSIAAELLKSAPEYMDIRKRDDIHDENKVWLARERTFGVSPLAPFPRCEADRHPPQPASPPSLTSSPSSVQPSPGAPVHSDTLIHANAGSAATPTSLVSLSAGAVDGSEACHVSRGGNSPTCLPSLPSVQVSSEASNKVHSDTLKHANAQSDVAQPSVSLSAGGPLFAGANANDGRLNGGGLGKPLGRGEACHVSRGGNSPSSISPFPSGKASVSQPENLEPENLQPAPGAPVHSDTLIHANAPTEPASLSSLPPLPSVEGSALSAGEDIGNEVRDVPATGDPQPNPSPAVPSEVAPVVPERPGYFARYP